MCFTAVEGIDRGDVRLYTLSSCAWCAQVKELLGRLGVRYRYVDTDLLEEKEQDRIVAFLDSITDKWGFPVLLIHDKYMVCGYREKETRRLLGFGEVESLGTERAREHEPTAWAEEVEKAFQRMERFCESRGLFLNPNDTFTKQLVKGLLDNQKKFGYWACPCRLASGDREKDRDIICPCVYMQPDVDEFGACYCGLYVSEEVARGEAEARTVPERRPKRGR